MSARVLRGFTAASAAVLLSCGLATAAPARAQMGDDPQRSFHRLATVPVFLNAAGPATETVAEITAVSADGNTLLSTDAVGERLTFTDITDPGNPQPDGDFPFVGALAGEPTSVAVFGGVALVAVDTSPSFTEPSGVLVVLDVAARTVVRVLDLGGQPDSIALSPDGATGGAYAAIAIENQRDEDVLDGALPQLPAGFLVTMPLTAAVEQWTPTAVPLAPSLAGVPGIVAAEDPEPEYVAINAANQVAVTLQENNGIAVVDLASSTVVRAFGAGAVDLAGVDTVEDDTIDPTGSLEDVPREPDAVAWLGTGQLITANEGDLAGGSRGWTIFDAATGGVVFDAGNTLERLAVSVGLYPESRSENKGTEPEGVLVATVDGRPHAFVGPERGNVVAVYDVSNPGQPVFRQVLPVTNGPEGLLYIPARDLFVVSSEVDVPEEDVRATITLFGLREGPPAFPSIASGGPASGGPRQAGAPIGWGALSGLSADPRSSDHLWTLTDSYYAPTQLLRVSVADEPALITESIVIIEGGAPLGVDGEGVFARRAGGFWVAAEGAAGPENVILLLDAAGAVQRRIPLPADVSSRLGGNGLEGITATGVGRSEQVYVALQRPLTGEPGVARIGRLDVFSGTWTWYAYPLDQPATPFPGDPNGTVIGLSEIAALDRNTFAVIERDNRPGVFAQVKRIYRFDIPRDPPGRRPAPALQPLEKVLARDLLPDLQAGNGWVQEKVEGLTVGRDRQVYVVTDNDGVEDATGETVFLRLGPARSVFGP